MGKLPQVASIGLASEEQGFPNLGVNYPLVGKRPQVADTLALSRISEHTIERFEMALT